MKDEVLRQREVEHETAALAVLRDVAHAGLEDRRARRVSPTCRLPADRDGAADGCRRPVSTVDQLGLAVAVDAGDADDLAGPNLEGDAATPSEARGRPTACRSATSSSGSPGLRRRLLDAEHDLTPDHHAREALPRSHPRAATVPTFLPRRSTRDPVGDLEHLVQLVADEDDRHALAP